MSDDTDLNLGDLEARASDMEDAELDEITGGFSQGNRAVSLLKLRTAGRRGFKSQRSVTPSERRKRMMQRRKKLRRPARVKRSR